MSLADGRRGLYPEIEPYDSGLLKVSAPHTLYYEQCGNPQGGGSAASRMTSGNELIET